MARFSVLLALYSAGIHAVYHPSAHAPTSSHITDATVSSAVRVPTASPTSSRSLFTSGSLSGSVSYSHLASSGRVLSSVAAVSFSRIASSRGAASSGLVSSGSASSSSRLVSSATMSRTLDSNGCEPLSTTPTSTITHINYVTMITSTTTYIVSTEASTVTSLYPGDDTIIKYYSVTLPEETTYTYTLTSRTIAPAATTVTVPTPDGFTPVLCLLAWRAVRTTTTVDVTVAQNSFIYISVPATTPSTVPTYTSTVTSSYTYTYPNATYTTITSIDVTSSATRTVYAACATNNIVDFAPDGQNLSLPVLTNTNDYGFNASGSTADAYDCCNKCQADPACAGASSYFNFGVFNCVFNQRYLSSNATCDPRFVAADITKNDIPFDPKLTISDSACGQWR